MLLHHLLLQTKTRIDILQNDLFFILQICRLLRVASKILTHHPLHLLQCLLERPTFVFHLANPLAERFVFGDDALKPDQRLLVCPVLIFNQGLIDLGGDIVLLSGICGGATTLRLPLGPIDYLIGALLLNLLAAIAVRGRMQRVVYIC